MSIAIALALFLGGQVPAASPSDERIAAYVKPDKMFRDIVSVAVSIDPLFKRALIQLGEKKSCALYADSVREQLDIYRLNWRIGTIAAVRRSVPREVLDEALLSKPSRRTKLLKPYTDKLGSEISALASTTANKAAAWIIFEMGAASFTVAAPHVGEDSFSSALARYSAAHPRPSWSRDPQMYELDYLTGFAKDLCWPAEAAVSGDR